jgi:hypothetical protein
MALKATYIGKEKILAAFEEKADTPFFSLWVGKARAEMNKDNDFEKAAHKLEKQIEAFIEEDNTDIFVIALHPEKKVSYKYEDCKDATLMYCQTRKNESSVAYFGSQQNNNINYQILEKLNAIESRVNAIESEEIEEEEEGEEIGNTDQVLIDKISGIVNSPIVNMLLGFLQNNNKPVGALAGTEQDELSDILTTLFNKGVTINHLKKLSEYPKERITMLLSML